MSIHLESPELSAGADDADQDELDPFPGTEGLEVGCIDGVACIRCGTVEDSISGGGEVMVYANDGLGYGICQDCLEHLYDAQCEAAPPLRTFLRVHLANHPDRTTADIAEDQDMPAEQLQPTIDHMVREGDLLMTGVRLGKGRVHPTYRAERRRRS